MIIFGLNQPIMFVVLFTYVFGGSINIPGAPAGSAQAYREFLMAGIFAQTVTFATAGAGAGIAGDMHKGLITGSAHCRWHAARSSPDVRSPTSYRPP